MISESDLEYLQKEGQIPPKKLVYSNSDYEDFSNSKKSAGNMAHQYMTIRQQTHF
ncbi:MAG: hypothetical protein J6W96_03605 [Alphaproteobacteria bacterium]|nr:hypothetical protein [Alphaproteobacteria bacterium]